MINIIHYDDDIFFLTYTVKKLSDGLRLDLDSSIFLNKIVEDIAFVSRSIEFFLESLKKNQLKVNRLTYLKNVYTLNKLFIELLNNILTEQVPFAQYLKEHFSRFATLRDHHIEYESELKDAIHPGTGPTDQENEVLSEEEYRTLLSQEEEN